VKAVVTGMIATYPVGGVAWDYGQYVLGLESLGFEVHYLEDTGGPSYDPRLRRYGEDPSYAVEFLRRCFAGLSPDLADRWYFRDVQGGDHGLERDEIAAVVAEADVFLNVSGSALLRPEYAASKRKVLIDTDPGWNHFVNYPRWDAAPGWQGALGYRAHDHFFTYAERIGRPGFVLPDLGLPWMPTRPPVAVEQWRPEPPGDRWTTVMTWNNFGRSIDAGDRSYGTKEMEFPKVESLPRRLPGTRFEVAVGGADPPVDRWRTEGWTVTDSESVSRTMDDYRRYIQGSRGEFSVAKNVYVETGSGWFSCRSVCYLAAGRPTVLQDTGFSEVIPTGEGLVAFTTPDEAALAVERVEADYATHTAAARALAEEVFDARIVLEDLLTRVGM
jgi:hypothetical protein